MIRNKELNERIAPIDVKLAATGKTGIVVESILQPDGSVLWHTCTIGHDAADISEEEEVFLEMFSRTFPDSLRTSNIELCDLLMRQVREHGFYLVLPESILAFIVHLHDQVVIA